MIIKGPNILINNTFFEPSLIRAEKAISKALEVHIACRERIYIMIFGSQYDILLIIFYKLFNLNEKERNDNNIILLTSIKRMSSHCII